jgi:exopolyphosphatase/guanosine-5'-triphosphate,3'-diphosphate pyrophosphatase
MKPRRFSVIDIGTNSARFLAAEVFSDGSWRPVADRREPCRLGEGLAADGTLGPAPMKRAIDAVAAFVAASQEFDAPIVRCVATYAVRKAANRDEFIKELRGTTGVELVVIPPKVEGRLSYRAVTETMGLGSGAKLQKIGVIDTGGGSVQLTVGIGCVPVASISMPLGAVAMTEEFGGPDASAGDRYEDLRDHIARTIEDATAVLPFLPRRLYGVGGGCTSAGVLVRQRTAGVLVPGGGPVPMVLGDPLAVSSGDVRELLRTIRPLTVAERAALPGLSVERSQIIVAGLAVIEGLLSRLMPHAMTTLDVGLRDGLVIETADATLMRAGVRQVSTRTMLPIAAARLSKACRAPEPHTTQVAMLSGKLLSGLCKLAAAGTIKTGRWARPRGAAILQAAAILHDSGVAISYKGHHKNAESLILFNGLSGVKRSATEVVASIARYHRRAMPSRRHEHYGSLPKKDRRLVRMLAGVLRVGDGLDRTHRQVVGDVQVVMEPELLRIIAITRKDHSGEPRAELAAAQTKSDLLSKVLGVPVSVEWKAGH